MTICETEKNVSRIFETLIRHHILYLILVYVIHGYSYQYMKKFICIFKNHFEVRGKVCYSLHIEILIQTYKIYKSNNTLIMFIVETY